MTTTMDRPMSKRNDTTVKVDVEAVKLAKLAAEFKEMSLAEYVSHLIVTYAPGDIDEGYAKLKGVKEPRRTK